MAADPCYARLARLAALACGAPLAHLQIAEVCDSWVDSTGAVLETAPRVGGTVAAMRAGGLEGSAAHAGDRPALVVWRECALVGKDGGRLGTLSVHGPVPISLEPADQTAVALLAEQIAAHVELRAGLAELALLTGVRVHEKIQRHNAIPAKALIESAPVAIYHTDAAGNMTYSNPEYRRMFGLSVGHGPDAWAERLHPADRARMESLWEEFCRAPKPSRFEGYRTLADDGSVRHFTEQVVAADGVPGWVGTITDLTELVVAREELERVHKQLVLASRQAGMAEVATNVLHNVGNILNSINISASLVADRIKHLRAEGVTRLATLLAEKRSMLAGFLTEDERGRRIPEYLAMLGRQLADDQLGALRELDSLRENLEHIKDTVNMQQSYAKLCGVTETLAVADLVEDSLRLNAGAFVRHGVTVERRFAPVPPITVDKHKVLQILVNLIRNAKYACDESGRSDKRITLHIAPAGSAVRISVSDNGAGIHPQHMHRLFSHGFTTRASGHGFGLHSGALAAQDLGGSLRAESLGPGRGATFVLELPLQPKESAHA